MASRKRISYRVIDRPVLSRAERTAFSLPSAFHRATLCLCPLRRPHSYSIPIAKTKIKNTAPGPPVPTVKTPPKIRATTHQITRVPVASFATVRRQPIRKLQQIESFGCSSSRGKIGSWSPTRGALLHLSHGRASPCGPALMVTHDPCWTSRSTRPNPTPASRSSAR